MPLIRDDLRIRLGDAREVMGAAALALAGIWLIWLGGYVLVPVGAGLMALAAVWARMAWRRMRFDPAITAPGVVEVIEGQVGYLGPETGGYVALPDLVEVRLLTIRGQRLWRLKQADGQALLVPVQAAGGAALFDALCTLPGMDASALSAGLSPGTAGLVVVWRAPSVPAPDAPTLPEARTH